MNAATTRLALVLSTCGLACLIGMNAIIHAAAPSASVGQLIFWRSIFALPPILIYLALRRQLGPSLRTKHPGKHLVRGVLGCIVMGLNFTALAYLPVSITIALTYLTPILAVGSAILLLGERPALPVVIGVVLGLAGVVVMLVPGLAAPDVGSGFLIGVAAGVGMAATNALSRVQVKDLTRTEPPASIALSFGVLSTLFGLSTLALGWPALDPATQALLVLAGILGGFGHIFVMEAVARAPVSLLAGYEYTGILWAFGFDLVLLGARPDLWAVGGATIIVLAALLVVLGPKTPTASA
jgi:drug/metabolite transporter (DMT)-like permease